MPVGVGHPPRRPGQRVVRRLLSAVLAHPERTHRSHPDHHRRRRRTTGAMHADVDESARRAARRSPTIAIVVWFAALVPPDVRRCLAARRQWARHAPDRRGRGRLRGAMGAGPRRRLVSTCREVGERDATGVRRSRRRRCRRRPCRLRRRNGAVGVAVDALGCAVAQFPPPSGGDRARRVPGADRPEPGAPTHVVWRRRNDGGRACRRPRLGRRATSRQRRARRTGPAAAPCS